MECHIARNISLLKLYKLGMIRRGKRRIRGCTHLRRGTGRRCRRRLVFQDLRLSVVEGWLLSCHRMHLLLKFRLVRMLVPMPRLLWKLSWFRLFLFLISLSRPVGNLNNEWHSKNHMEHFNYFNNLKRANSLTSVSNQEFQANNRRHRKTRVGH